MTGPSRGTHRRDATGAAAVEFALLLPILLLLVFGTIQYGMYFWAMQGGSDLARSAARRAAVGDPASCAAFRSTVRADIDSMTGSGTTAKVTRTYEMRHPPTVEVGDIVKVTVEFTSFDMQVPLLPFVNDGRVSATVKSRVDFVPQQPETCS